MAKPYVRRVPAAWWLKKPAYVKFMLREWSSVFIAVYCVILLVMLARLKAGPEAYHGFLAALRSPGWLLFHLMALLFAIYHSVTWFHATPKAMAPRLGEERVPPALLVAAHYLVWLVLSAGLIWFVLGR